MELRLGVCQLAKDLPWEKYASVWDKIVQYIRFLESRSSVPAPARVVTSLPFDMNVFDHNIFQ